MQLTKRTCALDNSIVRALGALDCFSVLTNPLPLFFLYVSGRAVYGRVAVYHLYTGAGMKFPLGHLVATPGALRAAIEDAGDNALAFIRRHAAGDWGEVDAHDQQENELSLRKGFRLLSAYRLSDGTRIWIITEADRSATTLLLPEEY